MLLLLLLHAALLFALCRSTAAPPPPHRVRIVAPAPAGAATIRAGADGFGVEEARALMTEAWLGTFGRSTVEVGLNRRRSEEIMLAGERRAVAGERERERWSGIKDGKIASLRSRARSAALEGLEDQPFALSCASAALYPASWKASGAATWPTTPDENFPPSSRSRRRSSASLSRS